MTNFKRQLRRSAALALILAASTPALAMAQGRARPVRVAIAAQPLGTALEQLARQSGTDILFTPPRNPLP